MTFYMYDYLCISFKESPAKMEITILLLLLVFIVYNNNNKECLPGNGKILKIKIKERKKVTLLKFLSVMIISS